MRWGTKGDIARHVCTVVMVLTLRGSSSLAQEPPPPLTPEKAGCQQTLARAQVRSWGTAIDCLVECAEMRRSDPTVVCSAEACLEAGRAKTEARVARRCGGMACPDCYAGGCPAFPDVALDAVRAPAELLIGQLFCDDTGSADGLTRAESRCQDALPREMEQFVAAFRQCIGNCEGDVRSGTIAAGDACLPSNEGRRFFDARTAACLDRARQRFRTSCSERCADLPDCTPQSFCDDVLYHLVLGYPSEKPDLSDVFCLENAFCGDGRVSGPDEECDPTCPNGDCTADPRGCSQAFFCGPDDAGRGCTCQPIPHECGNGIVEDLVGEQCDPPNRPLGDDPFYAFPCHGGDSCDANCRCASGQACLDDRLDPGEVCEVSTNEGCAPDEECFYCEQCLRLR